MFLLSSVWFEICLLLYRPLESFLLQSFRFASNAQILQDPWCWLLKLLCRLDLCLWHVTSVCNFTYHMGAVVFAKLVVRHKHALIFDFIKNVWWVHQAFQSVVLPLSVFWQSWLALRNEFIIEFDEERKVYACLCSTFWALRSALRLIALRIGTHSTIVHSTILFHWTNFESLCDSYFTIRFGVNFMFWVYSLRYCL